jgi:esterase
MSLDLAYAEHGSGGPPVIVLHGLLGSARNWTAIAKRLAAANHRVYALDLRNHGGSPWADDTGYAAMAEDVRRLMDRRGLAEAAVVGHSMGGKVAMVLALEHGERVERLVAVDIAPAAYAGGTFLSYIRPMRAIDPSGVSRRGEVDERLREAVPDSGVRAFLLQNLVSDEGGGFRWRVNLAALEAGMAEIVGFPMPEAGRAYAGRTLFLAGERSDYVRPEHRETIRRLFPNATVEVVPGAGHWVHAEQPERFLERLLAFLNEG